MERYHYRFVMSLKSGLRQLGEGMYGYPLIRGQVVTLTDHNVPSPDPSRGGFVRSDVRCVIEQVAHTQVNVRPPIDEPPTSRGHIHTTPLPHSVCDMIVYVSLLDDAGFIVPLERGVVPGLHIAPQPGIDPTA